MALLSRAILTDRVRWQRAALALLLIVLAAGCALFGLDQGPPGFVFRHSQHGPATGLECANCHRTVERADDPGMPQPSQCQVCHQKIDAEKPPERRALSLFDDRTFKRTARPRLQSEVLFSHQGHIAKGTQCTACHAGLLEDAPQPAMRMNDCMSCHRQQNAANECATCHREVRIDRAPANHAFGWEQAHGRVARAHGTATVDDCSICHQESTCASCHLAVPPKNHNNYFRLRGHGVMARMDRQNCEACHRTDSCDACHKDSRPINHTPSFGAPRDTHCVSCHLPLASSECATCHRSTPSHASATPLPPGHTPAMNCRQCHGQGVPLQHVDNGMECTACHR